MTKKKIGIKKIPNECKDIQEICIIEDGKTQINNDNCVNKVIKNDCKNNIIHNEMNIIDKNINICDIKSKNINDRRINKLSNSNKREKFNNPLEILIANINNTIQSLNKLLILKDKNEFDFCSILAAYIMFIKNTVMRMHRLFISNVITSIFLSGEDSRYSIQI